MAYIDCVVDTQPMAQEIDSVSNHIKGTTAAVVGMQAAVIKAEEEASNHVCENVNRGFYTLIHSQISQKIAKLKSEVDSHLMQLNQQRKQLLAIKSRMERDYNMISARYLKLFNGLNQNLQQRVFELDKPTIEFAVKDVDKITNRTRLLPGAVPVVQLESLEMSQRILASNIKYRGLSVINSMKRFLRDMYAQKRLTDQILLPEQTSAQRGRTPVFRKVRAGGWYLLLLSEDKNWNPVVGQSYKVELEGFDDQVVDATVTSFARSGGELLVRMSVSSDVRVVLNVRTANAQVGELYVSGLKVPLNALRQQNGQMGIVLTDDGGRFVPVTVIMQDNSYAVIQPLQAGALMEKQKIRVF